jgi:phenylacetate-CoA ligase
MACSRPGATGLHLTEDAAVYEPIDAHGRAVRPGTPAAKLLVTSVINRTLPLLRYELAIRSPSAQHPIPIRGPAGASPTYRVDWRR